jgi:hypothetical protein
LRNLPHSLVKVLQILGDLSDLLDTPIISNQLVSDVIIPQAKGNKVPNKMGVDADKLSCKDSPGVEICSVRLETFIVS